MDKEKERKKEMRGKKKKERERVRKMYKIVIRKKERNKEEDHVL